MRLILCNNLQFSIPSTKNANLYKNKIKDHVLCNYCEYNTTLKMDIKTPKEMDELYLNNDF